MLVIGVHEDLGDNMGSSTHIDFTLTRQHSVDDVDFPHVDIACATLLLSCVNCIEALQ